MATASRTTAAVLGFLLMAAYWPGIAGLARTPRWIVGGLIVVAFFFAPRVVWTRAHVAGVALVAALLLSLVLHPNWDGGDALLRLVIVAVAFAWGSTLTDITPFVKGAVVGLALSSVLICGEYVGVVQLDNLDAPAGLFYNRNYLAEAAALVLVAVVVLRLWWLGLPLLPALLLPHSRGALLAAAVSLLWVFDWRERGWDWKLRGLVLILASAAFFAVVYRGVDASMLERVALWRDTLNALTLAGHGLGSFWTTFPSHMHYFDMAVTHTRPEHPHNEFLLVLYEAGVFGGVAFVVFAAAVWLDAERKFRAVLVALFICFMVSVVSNNPATVICGAVLAGFAVGNGHRVAVASGDRGNTLRWGMVDAGG